MPLNEEELVLAALAMVGVMTTTLVVFGAPAFDVVAISIQILGLVILYFRRV